jgi:hypothetical protein
LDRVFSHIFFDAVKVLPTFDTLANPGDLIGLNELGFVAE